MMADNSHNAGWTIFSYLIAAMVFYGVLGWLVSRWTHIALIFPIGMLVGIGVGVFAIIYKYGRQ
jgi:ATP synthase protein I